MKVLVVGSGGREHAIAWKLAQSPRLSRLWIAPGNAGTASLGENVVIAVEDVQGLVGFARDQSIELVIVGPEAALEVGLVDALRQAGIRAFGPTQSAARIETSKSFAKDFMARWSIPTARYATFRSYEQALSHVKEIDYPIVIKTSGLAAGKGVILPENFRETQRALEQIMLEHAFGSAGDEVVIEERLEGEEVSLLAFSDGLTVQPMPPTQDHKRLLDGDQGPNTGGMGAYAPVPACPPALVETMTRTVLQPAIDGLRAEGCPFTGVLYAGLMLTADGPRVLEFNCRFGDPETQVILPLLENDLIEVVEACVDGRLDRVQFGWKRGAAATVVLASGGYPGSYSKGKPVSGLDHVPAGAMVFHAGTKLENSQVVTSGGRVLNVTAIGQGLNEALGAAYSAVEQISFEGMQYRKDIAHHAAATGTARVDEPKEQNTSAYRRAGVDIDAGNRAVNLMRNAVQSTYTPAVLAGIGAFGGLFDAKVLAEMQSPVLVASTDGVGTKVRLAAQVGRYESIGQDIVNHCINDILVQGARPLFFLDYFASSKIDPEMVAAVVSGISKACRDAGCVLLGGETAEMPGVYGSGEFDLAGTIVGTVERANIYPRADLQPGDLLIGLASSGPHTNGYSLIRKVFAELPLETQIPELGTTLADALLAPHRSYLQVLECAMADEQRPIKALAHLTGGGFVENIPRVLPDGLRAVIDTQSWKVPALFQFIQSRGGIETKEMYRVFNMGIGMVMIVAPENLKILQEAIHEPCWVIGKLVAGEKGVELR